ncbi:hypothetical protein ACEWY4_013069 [Coilia grayii]|uniref:Uncharacterized protein n=1 Tax=Coilia grayii TaxID=363190 RepID=A0ABD1JV86_9TELE
MPKSLSPSHTQIQKLSLSLMHRHNYFLSLALSVINTKHPPKHTHTYTNLVIHANTQTQFSLSCSLSLTVTNKHTHTNTHARTHKQQQLSQRGPVFKHVTLSPRAAPRREAPALGQAGRQAGREDKTPLGSRSRPGRQGKTPLSGSALRLGKHTHARITDNLGYVSRGEHRRYTGRRWGCTVVGWGGLGWRASGVCEPNDQLLCR